jgi:hypothetical protein
MVSAEDSAVYDRMEEKVVALGKEIERLERQRNIDDELNKTIDTALKVNPGAGKPEAGHQSGPGQRCLHQSLLAGLPGERATSRK